ncbi:MAG: carboxylating nicotinate-nucleotide diphosphorylase [Armatimonadota bacterium]
MAEFDYSLSGIAARALAEDLGPGDITSELSVSERMQADGEFVAKEPGVLSGLDICKACFVQMDPECDFDACLAEGGSFEAGARLATVTGNARAILAAERCALNFLQRLCGVATLTHQFVSRVQSTGATIVDTRKTTPGLRVLEKRAVLAGGGANHRFALYDGILLKDNHIAMAGGVKGAVEGARAGAPHTLKVEVEVTTLDELDTALETGADIVLLDNMTIEQLAEAVSRTGGRVPLEASGGVSLDTVADIAATGVDYISVGALTHSAPAIDISLEITAD